MRIRSSSEFGEQHSRFGAEAAEGTLRELEEQYAAGEIERHAYFKKKPPLLHPFSTAT